jgi:putative ABC transport system substrate-binding protein
VRPTAFEPCARRRFLAGALSLSALPLYGAPPRDRLPRVGFLVAGGPEHATREPALLEALRELGYVDGKTMRLEMRYAQGVAERLPALAAELARLPVDVIVAFTNVCAFAARDATQSIPIVVWGAHGAVQTGLVASLARPGRNVTGVESLAPELDAKRIELLKELLPRLRRVALLYDASDRGSPLHLQWTQAAGQAFGIDFSRVEVRRAEDFGPALASLEAAPVDALLTFTGALTASNWPRVAEFSQAHWLPTVCEFRHLAEAGCLMSYGPTYVEFARRNANQVDKILNGARPADLPVEQPTRFELVVNLSTARRLGVTLPPAVLLRVNAQVE